jgi:hypothetical protein
MKLLRVSAFAAALLVALVAGTATSPSEAGPSQLTKSPPPVLGISYRPSGSGSTGTLAWFDPLTLEKLRGRKAPLGAVLGSWAFSADRAVLALGSCGGTFKPRMRFVNARAMRVLGDLRLPAGYECASSLVWLSPDRLLAVVRRSASSAIAVIDPIARRVLHLTELPASPWATARSASELVLMFGSRDSFAPAEVAVVDREGRMRTVSADRVLAGTVVDYASEDYRARTISPGFAVDQEGRRAFLVPASGPIAEVDLETLEVAYHELDRPSLVGRFLRWLEPAAEAKLMEGPAREARWLGDGMLAVSGMDYSIAKRAGESVEVGKPVGVKLVDTHSWRTRMLSAESSGFAVAAGLVIAQGGWFGEQRAADPGIVAFGLDGHERWRLHRGEGRWLDPVGSLGYGYVWLGEGRREVIDTATGTLLRTIKRNEQTNPWPDLLAEQASSW